MRRNPVQSSNIKSIGYQPIQRKLEVEFKSGDVYRYKAVPRNVYRQMMASGSKGSFLHHHVKYKYPYRKYQSKDGDFVQGEWKTLEKPAKKTAFDEQFAGYLEKTARTKFTKDQAESALKKLGIDLSKEKWGISDFLDGLNVELEHGTVDSATNITDDDLIMTAKIALAHLNEHWGYYPALKKMEDDLTKQEKKAFDEQFAEYLEKIAASLDAERKKQYWQLLKRLHGGTDLTMNSILKNRDIGIYHGTSGSAIENILREGIRPADNAHYGAGAYMGSYRAAKDSAVVKTWNPELDTVNNFARPQIRLKTPSEMRELKERYPDVQNVHGRDIDNNDHFTEHFKSINFEGGVPAHVLKRTSGRHIFSKQAALNPDVELYPHQQRIVDSPETSKIIAHSVGGGKTLTSIAKFEKMKEEGKANHALVVTPASLRDNFGEKGVGKFTDSKYNIVGNKQEIQSKKYHDFDPSADYNILSYEMYRKDPTRALMTTKADTVIQDESHRGRNDETLTVEQLKRYRPLYKNHISLTGSIVNNTPADVQPIVDVVSGGKAKLGKDKTDFERKFIQRSNAKKYQDKRENRRPIVGFKNRDFLGKELTKYIDYEDYGSLKDIADMPEKNLQVKKIPISKEQAKYYKKMLKNDPAMMHLIKEKRLETLKDDEVARAFNKLIEERKLMNSVGSVVPGIPLSESAKITPKTQALISDLDDYLKKTPDGQAILMSHLINGGTDVLEEGLKERGIPYGTFLGKGNKGVTEQSRQQAVRDYNAGKLRAMIISEAGGEGLSLDDTTYEAALDPHFNPERMKQMEARGIRSGGLKGRDDRSVQVTRYLATMPKTFGIFRSSIRTPDEFIYQIQENKDRQNQMLYDLLKQYQNKKN